MELFSSTEVQSILNQSSITYAMDSLYWTRASTNKVQQLYKSKCFILSQSLKSLKCKSRVFNHGSWLRVSVSPYSFRDRKVIFFTRTSRVKFKFSTYESTLDYSFKYIYSKRLSELFQPVYHIIKKALFNETFQNSFLVFFCFALLLLLLLLLSL